MSPSRARRFGEGTAQPAGPSHAGPGTGVPGPEASPSLPLPPSERTERPERAEGPAPEAAPDCARGLELEELRPKEDLRGLEPPAKLRRVVFERRTQEVALDIGFFAGHYDVETTPSPDGVSWTVLFYVLDDGPAKRTLQRFRVQVVIGPGRDLCLPEWASPETSRGLRDVLVLALERVAEQVRREG